MLRKIDAALIEELKSAQSYVLLVAMILEDQQLNESTLRQLRDLEGTINQVKVGYLSNLEAIEATFLVMGCFSTRCPAMKG
jgi:hypothetical protein